MKDRNSLDSKKRFPIEELTETTKKALEERGVTIEDIAAIVH